jgi:hypothetical protein
MSTDRCEMIDLASTHPEKLAEMVARWEACEARYRGDSQRTA